MRPIAGMPGQSTVSHGAVPRDGASVLKRLHELPGGSALLELAAERDDAVVIGGVVRDVLLDPDATPREIDVVVDFDASSFARDLARELQTLAGENAAERLETTFHERFRTAIVSWPGGKIDIAMRRSENYPANGSLPDVDVGTPEDDVRRRDFTINTLSVAIGGSNRGELHGFDGSREDLAAGILRVLHDESFRNDPTRLMRLARYRARLGFTAEPHTAQLAVDAIAAGVLDTVSLARLGAELRLALAEPDPVAALESLAELGVLGALHESLTLNPPVARAAIEMLPPCEDAWPDVLLLAALLLPPDAYDTSDYETRLRVLLDGWEFPAAERERAVHSAILAPRLAERLGHALEPSEIYEVAHSEPLEAIALAAALAEAGASAEADGSGAAATAGRRWLSELRHVALEISGDDLLAAGVAAGPEVGQRLRRALMRKLDDGLSGHEAELRTALE